MPSDQTQSLAEAARKRGNDLYQMGKLEAAEIEYKKAIELAPNDPTPLSNLSSVNFELGHYASAAAYVLKSLELTESGEETARKKQTLYGRLVKCYIHEGRFGEARSVLDDISDKALADSVRQTLDTITRWSLSAPDAARAHRTMIFDRIPRFHSTLEDVPEYYAIGHDTAESLFDEELVGDSSTQRSVSLMFCGSGDARNVFATIVGIWAQELTGKKVCKDLHITILDLKPASIARTLIFFDMLMAYASLKAKDVSGCEDALTGMAYIYTGHVVPAAVNQRLQVHIEGLIKRLEADEPLFDWLFVPQSTRKPILHVLRQWQGHLDGDCYRAPFVRTTIRDRVRRNRFKESLIGGPSKTPKGCAKDRKSFDDLGILLPSKAFAKRRDPPLVDLMGEYASGSKDAIRRLAEHVDANWVTNVTLLDFDHIKAHCSGTWWSREEDKVPSIETDPVELVERLPSFSKRGDVLTRIGGFFDVTALSLSRLTILKRLTTETFVGEMTDIMERIRWGCLETRDGQAHIDTAKFPGAYDRIHMSNIPDYIGGPLTAAMYGSPLLKESDSSHLQFTVLLNSPMFDTHEHFQAEYALMPDTKRLGKHFALARIPAPAPDAAERARMKQLRESMGLGGNFMFEDYMHWERLPARKLVRGGGLLPRQALEKWLYGHFLKISLPYPRAKINDRPVFSPLNLTALLRLICHLAEIGYPAHWLSDVISVLCGGGPNGNMTTTARPPKRVSTTAADVEAVHPAAQMTVAPWVAQFTTLLSIWTPLMPFGFTAPPGALVSATEIGEFSVAFSPFEEDQPRVPHFLLVFCNLSLGGLPDSPGGLRRLLRDDEEGDKSPDAAKLRREGIHMVPAMRYATATFTATFWLRTDVMQSMKDGDDLWVVGIWRLDIWAEVHESVLVKDSVELKRLWTD